MTGAGDTPKVFSLRDNKNRDPAGHSGQHRVWTIGGRGSFIDHTDCCRPTSGSGSNTWSQPARRPAHQTSRSYPGVEKVARKSALTGSDERPHGSRLYGRIGVTKTSIVSWPCAH